MEGNENPDIQQPSASDSDHKLWRDLAAFFFIGMCNVYGFFNMLIAAHDLLYEVELNHEEKINRSMEITTRNLTEARDCNSLSTGVVLLADIIPALIAKLILPFTPNLFNVKIFTNIVLTSGAYITVAYAKNQALVLLGVAMMSLSMGIGESTMIGTTTYYNKHTISAYSSGTGCAGLIIGLVYTGLKQLGISTRTVLMLQLFIPFTEVFVVLFLLRPPKGFRRKGLRYHPVHYGTAAPIPVISISKEDLHEDIVEEIGEIMVPSLYVISVEHEPETQKSKKQKMKEHFKEEIHFVPSITKYIIPLFLNYLFSYFINQALFEHIYFQNNLIDKSGQYRIYQVTYSIGVFILKSIGHLVYCKHIWITTVVIFLAANVMFFEAVYFFMPSIYIVLTMGFVQGVMQGYGYVNTFYRITNEVPIEKRMFAMALTDFADTPALTIVGFLAIPVHDFICSLPVPSRIIQSFRS